MLITGKGCLQGSRVPLGFLVVLFWTAFILYSTILGSVHLARYIIFVMPGMVLVGMLGGHWLWNSWRPHTGSALAMARAMAVAGFILALGGIFVLETNLRLKLDSQASLWMSMRAPEERKAFSDALFNQLGQPKDEPIIIGLQEVQARYWLDERFLVRSLDGRVDPVLLEHAARDGVDHIGYIKERGIQFLLETPTYNRDSNQWSLRRLSGLKPNQSVSYQGLTFTGLPMANPASVGSAPGGSGRLRWFAGGDGASVLQRYLVSPIRVARAGSSK